ncbi:MAG: hypothetical protein FWD68_13930 [Alphaproteobacteria bacterium]|nr:hypothetical protein [Alphaproteobacteria bacterium]
MMNPVVIDLLNEARHYAGGEPSPALRRCSGAFLRRIKANPEILQAAAEAIETLPSAGAGWIALVLGTGVEEGADPAGAMPALERWLRSRLSRLSTPGINEDEEGEEEEVCLEPTPGQEELIEALESFCQGFVAHLAAMPAERKKLSEDRRLLRRLTTLGGISYAVGWVLEALQRRSGSLVVLHPPTGAGVKLRYENVARNFHLFSLLQVALGTRLPGGRPPDLKIAAAARGETSDEVLDCAWWHYGDPRWKTPEIGGLIRGAGLVTEIPVSNGSRVLLLWPAIVGSRKWNAGFFSPHLDALPANVVVEGDLSPDSAQEWLKTLGVA